MSSVFNFNGGIIGKVNNPTLSSASGVWGLREHSRARRDGVWPGSDPYFADVVLLCDFEGTDGDTSYTEKSNSARSATFGGNADISSDQSKFGSTSLHADGATGSFVSFPDSNDWQPTTDFCIEFWIRYNSTSGTNLQIIGQWVGSGYSPYLLVLNGGNVEFYGSSAGSAWNIAQTQTVHTGPSTGIWYHYALTWDSSTIRFFVDGTQTWSTAYSSTWLNTAQPLYIGGKSGAAGPNVYIDSLRITMGNARYTSNFTPPTTEHALQL